MTMMSCCSSIENARKEEMSKMLMSKICEVLGIQTFKLTSEKGRFDLNSDNEIKKKIQKAQASLIQRKRKSDSGHEILQKKLSRVSTDEDVINSTMENLSGMLEDMNVQDVYFLGQNLACDSIKEVSRRLTERDYFHISNFLRTEEEPFLGATFVPDCYIPFGNDFEEAARQVYETLRSYFQAKKDAVLCIQDLKMIAIGRCRSEQHQSLDFLVVNYTLQYIMNIELKKWRGAVLDEDMKLRIEALEARENIEGIKKNLEQWLGSELKGNWKYVASMYSNDSISCENKDYFINGQDLLLKRIQEIEDNIRKPEDKYPEDFQTIAQYLLFCTPAMALPVKSNLIRSVHKKIQKLGSAKGICLYAFPTPQQRQVLSWPLVVFAAPWGSGKTTLMVAKTIDLATSGQKVLFIIFCNGSITTNNETLLFLEIRDKLADYENVKVISMLFEDGRNNGMVEAADGFENVIIDEFFSDFGSLSQVSQEEISQLVSGKSTVWISFSNTYFGTRLDDFESPEDLLTSWFPTFKVAKMTMPLRMPTNVAQGDGDWYIYKE